MATAPLSRQSSLAPTPRTLPRERSATIHLLLCLVALMLARGTQAAGSSVALISAALDGTAAKGTAEWPMSLPAPLRGARAVSDDGRYVAFQSTGGNLVTGVAGGTLQIYLRDRWLGTTALVSHSTAGLTTAGNGPSQQAVVSGDGRYVAFTSEATDLTASSDNPLTTREIYRYTVATGAIVDVSYSATADGGAGPLPWNGTNPRISGDGAVIAFASKSTNLLPDQVDSNGGADLFVWSGTLALASRAHGSSTTTGNGTLDPTEGFDLSADGRYLTFLDTAANLAASSDTNGSADLFQFDRATGSMRRVSEATTGGASDGSVDPAFASSPKGDWVAFSSSASDLATGIIDTNGEFDVYIWERAQQKSYLVSHLNGDVSTAAGANSVRPSISEDGSCVLLQSERSTDLIGGTDANGAPDLFLYDRVASAITLVSHEAEAADRTASGGNREGALSRDGAWAVFTSDATNLIAGQTEGNGTADVFFWARGSGEVTLVSHALSSTTQTGNGASDQPQLTSNGGAVVFRSAASNLTAASDTNGAADVFGTFDLPAIFDDSFEGGSTLAWSSTQ